MFSCRCILKGVFHAVNLQPVASLLSVILEERFLELVLTVWARQPQEQAVETELRKFTYL